MSRAAIITRNREIEATMCEQLASAEPALADLNRRLRERDPDEPPLRLVALRVDSYRVLQDPTEPDGQGGWRRASAGQAYVQGRGTTAAAAVQDAAELKKLAEVAP